MSQSTSIVGFLGAAFVIYVTAKGELPTYLGFFRIGGNSGSSGGGALQSIATGKTEATGKTVASTSSGSSASTGDAGEDAVAAYGNTTPTVTQQVTQAVDKSQATQDNIASSESSQTGYQKTMDTLLAIIAGVKGL